MTVLVAWNPSREQWQVSQTNQFSMLGGDLVSNHDKKSAALKKARRIADSGEEIRAENKSTGNVVTVRAGR